MASEGIRVNENNYEKGCKQQLTSLIWCKLNQSRQSSHQRGTGCTGAAFSLRDASGPAAVI